MTDCYKTNKEALKEAQEKANKYDNLKKQMKQEIKRHKALVETSREEDYKLAHSMAADFLEELLEEYGGTED